MSARLPEIKKTHPTGITAACSVFRLLQTMRLWTIFALCCLAAISSVSACATGDPVEFGKEEPSADASTLDSTVLPSTDAGVDSTTNPNEPCGAADQACCVDKAPCGASLQCVANVCRPAEAQCGEVDQVCCSQARCFGTNECNLTTGKCEGPCGQTGNSCCPGGTCGAGMLCDLDAGSVGVCRGIPCGQVDEPCCKTGLRCGNPDLHCTSVSPQTCKFPDTCGRQDLRCCGGIRWCDLGWVCNGDAGGVGRCNRDPNCKAVGAGCSATAQCCNGSNCVNGTCQACGDELQTCCNFGPTCNNGLRCNITASGGPVLCRQCPAPGEACGPFGPICCTGMTCNASNKCCRNAGQAYTTAPSECCSGAGANNVCN